jgi:hypothetical protein
VAVGRVVLVCAAAREAAAARRSVGKCIVDFCVWNSKVISKLKLQKGDNCRSVANDGIDSQSEERRTATQCSNDDDG